MMADGYDYVIVGGGSSGCVLANRLSEDRNCRVLLLEAGGRDRHPLIHMPVGFAKMTTGPHTWGLSTAPQKHANDREIPYAQARVIGGGSSINAEVFTRGNPVDYDRWAQDASRISRSISCGPRATRSCRATGMAPMASWGCRTSPTRSR